MPNDLIPQQAHTLEVYAQNLADKLKFCALLQKTQMCPPTFKTPEEVLMVIIYGEEIGFTPMQALQNIYVIQGRPTLEANGIKALILTHGGRLETVESSDTTCTLRGVRGAWSEEYTYTLKDAERAGLASKDNWRRMPKQMLYARCATALGRNMWSDLLKGFTYSREEMEDIEVSAPSITKARKMVPEVEGETVWNTTVYFYDFDTIDLKREQEEFLHKNLTYYQANLGCWMSPKDLGPKFERFKIKDPRAKVEVMEAGNGNLANAREDQAARRAEKTKAIADDLKAKLGDKIEIESVELKENV